MGHLSILEWMKEQPSKKKIVHLGTTYIKWAEFQMTDDSEMGLINITGHYMHCFFYIRVP